MKKAVLISMAVVSLILGSCTKEIDYIKGDVNTPVDEMVVSANFDWKTSKDVVLNLTGYTNGLVRVESTTGVVYQTAGLLKYQPYTMKLTVPAREGSVNLVFGGKSVKVSIGSGEVTYRFSK